MKHETVLLFGILSVLSIPQIDGENIVFLSSPIYSHLSPMVKTANELAELGHTSYIIILEKYRQKFHSKKNGVKFIIVDEFQEWLNFKQTTINFFLPESETSTREFVLATDKLCDRYLFDEGLFQTLKSLNLSLAIVNGNTANVFFSIFAYKLNIPFILFGLHIQLNWHRTPWAPTVFPDRAFPFSDRMTFTEKIKNFYRITADYIYPKGIPNRSVKEYVPERPAIDFRDFMKQCELFIIDSDSYMDYPLPALPNLKFIGGLTTQPAVALQGEILEFVKSSKHGIIVVSSGSFVSWPTDHINKMAEAFSQIKYDIVWKNSNSSYSRQNVYLTKWLPQNDLLGHPNTKLFITHCGNNGQYESLYHAVPMIGFPIFADQFFNARRMKAKGYGIAMDIYYSTVDELLKNIEEVIENQKYKNNIAKVSHMFHSQKDRPAEKAARHIDEIIKYGGSHLRSACQEIQLYEFFMLDILALIFLAVFIVMCLTIFILGKCVRYFSIGNKTKIA